MKDFLGNEFGVGDTIVYPKTCGQAVALCKGVVLKFNDSGSVSIQPETESWGGGQERRGATRYIDTRTGKGFNPHSASGKKHLEREYGYIHKESGEWISYEDYKQKQKAAYATGDAYTGIDRGQGFEMQYQWTEVIWKDYVKIETKVKPVTITRTDNIILIEKASDA